MVKSVVLIGMPGAGKSTLGRALAELWGWPFIDTDQLIEAYTGRSLQGLLEAMGYQALRDLEARVIEQTEFPKVAVVATGGSVIYRARAMDHLRRQGVCVFLYVSLDTVRARVGNLSGRGFSCEPGQSLADVYAERQSLYRRYADCVVNCDGRSEQSVLAELNQMSLFKA